jgi:hypothetical protein
MCSADELASLDAAHNDGVDHILSSADFQLLTAAFEELGLRIGHRVMGDKINEWAGKKTSFDILISLVFRSIDLLAEQENDSRTNSAIAVCYSGHGIPRPPNGPLAVSACPKSTMARVDSSARDCFLEAGDWYLHQKGCLGIRTVLAQLEFAVKGNQKELVLICDCCHSGRWCDVLRQQERSNDSPHVTILASAQDGQNARGGVFMPVFAKLQNAHQRHKWISAFAEYVNERSTPQWQGLAESIAACNEKQSMQFFSTRINRDSADGSLVYEAVLARDHDGHGNDRSLWLFTNSEFFWFCAHESFADAYMEQLFADESDGSKAAPPPGLEGTLCALLSQGFDYKLKTMKGNKTKKGKKYTDTYMALVRVGQLSNQPYELHFHYKEKVNQSPHEVPSTVTRINVFRVVSGVCIRPSLCEMFLSSANFAARWTGLISAVHNGIGPQKMNDSAHWNASSSDLSEFGTFRLVDVSKLFSSCESWVNRSVEWREEQGSWRPVSVDSHGAAPSSSNAEAVNEEVW